MQWMHGIKEEVTLVGSNGQEVVHITQAATGVDLQQGRERRKRRKRRSENIHRHSDRCMLGWSDMLAGGT